MWSDSAHKQHALWSPWRMDSTTKVSLNMRPLQLESSSKVSEKQCIF